MFYQVTIGNLTQIATRKHSDLQDLTVVDDHTQYSLMVGTLADRPTASVNGRLYYATDNLDLYLDDGSAWTTVSSGVGDIIKAFNAGLAFSLLDDSPGAYTGNAGKFLQVNSGETALQYAAAPVSNHAFGSKSGSPYTTSSTSATTIDGTNLVLTVSGATPGQPVLVLWNLFMEDTSSQGDATISVLDSINSLSHTSPAVTGNLGTYTLYNGSMILAAPAASFTLTLQWAVTAGTWNLQNNSTPDYEIPGFGYILL